MNFRHLEDIHTGQQFEVSRGGIVERPKWLGLPVGMNSIKCVSFHLSSWVGYTDDGFKQIASPQDRMLTRLHELRNKRKIFKWLDYDGTVKGFVIITSWRKNKYDMVVDGRSIEENLELMKLMEAK